MGREEGLKTCAEVSLDHGEREGANSTMTCSLSMGTCPDSEVTGFRGVPSGPPGWTVMTPGPFSFCPYFPEQRPTRQGLQEHAPVSSCPVRHLLGDALTPPGSFPFGATFPYFLNFLHWVDGKWGLIYIYFYNGKTKNTINKIHSLVVSNLTDAQYEVIENTYGGFCSWILTAGF